MPLPQPLPHLIPPLSRAATSLGRPGRALVVRLRDEGRIKDRDARDSATPRLRFSDFARDGDDTLSLGPRGGLVWVAGRRVELEGAIEFQRLAGYEKEGVDFPVKEIWALQFGVGIPIL